MLMSFPLIEFSLLLSSSITFLSMLLSSRSSATEMAPIPSTSFNSRDINLAVIRFFPAVLGVKIANVLATSFAGTILEEKTCVTTNNNLGSFKKKIPF